MRFWRSRRREPQVASVRDESLFYVRSFPRSGNPPYIDEGPWDHYLAGLVLAHIGVDAHAVLDEQRVAVERAFLVPADQYVGQPPTSKQGAHWRFLRWQYQQPGFLP